MRITTKVIQNNSLNNINTNKLLQDKLSQQMSTEKKVNRPSDDPIVAIRALRLRTNVNQVTQYYERNVPDAESWLEVTESALSSMSEVITDMIAQCTKGSNEDLTTSDRETILTALKALKEEVYSTGNADYAGRYIFTGYRTDTALTFGDDTTKPYIITEQLDNTKIDTLTYVDSVRLLEINESNYKEFEDANGDGVLDDTALAGIKEQDIEQHEIYRLRLSYGETMKGENPSIQVMQNGVPVDIDQMIAGVNYDTKSIHENPYMGEDLDGDGVPDGIGDNDVILIEETGELLLGKNIYNELMKINDEAATSELNEGEIRIVYKKDTWDANDLRPEHYFACETPKEGDDLNVPDTDKIIYNKDYLLGISDEDKQSIEYDVGLNQRVRVNTTADEVFTHAIGRDVEDMIRAMEDTVAMEKLVKELEKRLEEEINATEREKEIMTNQLAAAQKAFTFLNEKTQKLFESGISKMQGHLDVVNFAVTENGTRGQKLELISNRLMSQKTNFETLKSENEDIDITDVAIKLSSAELTYSSALMATGKVLQNNLMNFI